MSFVGMIMCVNRQIYVTIWSLLVTWGLAVCGSRQLMNGFEHESWFGFSGKHAGLVLLLDNLFVYTVFSQFM